MLLIGLTAAEIRKGTALTLRLAGLAAVAAEMDQQMVQMAPLLAGKLLAELFLYLLHRIVFLG